MSFTPKQKKMISAIPLMILVYMAITLLLYNMILEPKVNKITGAVVTSVNVTKALPSYCNFSFYEGENLVSFHCISGVYPLGYLLSNITGAYDSIFSYESQDLADPWKSYNPYLPNWTVQDLSWIKEGNGYWIIMNQNESYYLEGIHDTHTQKSLYKGWNLVGYTKETPLSPQIAFANIAGNYNLILQYKRENNSWYFYDPNDNSSTLTIIEPDYGYWINMTQDDTWVYP